MATSDINYLDEMLDEYMSEGDLFNPPMTQGSCGAGWDIDTDDEMLNEELSQPDIFWSGITGSSSHLFGYSNANFSPDELPTNTGHILGVNKNREWVIAQIESIFEEIAVGLQTDANQSTIILRSRASLSRRKVGLIAAGGVAPDSRLSIFSWPGNNAREAWRFSVVLRILELIHSCLLEDVIITKRDIYYRSPDLFGKQSVVDRYVDDLACTFGVSRSQLNVACASRPSSIGSKLILLVQTATAKSLVAGNFALQREGLIDLYGLSEKEGTLVPSIYDTDKLDLSRVCWVLVIEKEATFRSILSSKNWAELGSRGVVLTAKGYPDLASRKFLRHLADSSPGIPMFALVDFDPDGIAIMSTYKYGSYRLAHEHVSGQDTSTLGLPKLGWLGIQSYQVANIMQYESLAGGNATDAQSMMRLTPRDRIKATRMLEWDVCAENGPERRWRGEIQAMLMLNVKAEMQIMEEQRGGLAGWLDRELGGVFEKGSTAERASSRSGMISSDDEMLLDY